MIPEITAAHREILGHLLEEESSTLGIVPAALAGHYPPGSYEADMGIDWIDPIPVFAHPADPARLLVCGSGRRLLVSRGRGRCCRRS